VIFANQWYNAETHDAAALPVGAGRYIMVGREQFTPIGFTARIPRNEFTLSKQIAGHRVLGYAILSPKEIRVQSTCGTMEGPIESLLPKRLSNFILRKLRRAQVELSRSEDDFSIVVRTGPIVLEEYTEETAGRRRPEIRDAIAEKSTEMALRWEAGYFFEAH
jgi:hypothetical protein